MNLPNIFAFFRFLLLNLHFLALLLFLPIEKDALQRWNASLELLFAMPPKRRLSDYYLLPGYCAIGILAKFYHNIAGIYCRHWLTGQIVIHYRYHTLSCHTDIVNSVGYQTEISKLSPISIGLACLDCFVRWKIQCAV